MRHFLAVFSASTLPSEILLPAPFMAATKIAIRGTSNNFPHWFKSCFNYKAGDCLFLCSAINIANSLVRGLDMDLEKSLRVYQF